MLFQLAFLLGFLGQQCHDRVYLKQTASVSRYVVTQSIVWEYQFGRYLSCVFGVQIGLITTERTFLSFLTHDQVQRGPAAQRTQDRYQLFCYYRWVHAEEDQRNSFCSDAHWEAIVFYLCSIAYCFLPFATAHFWPPATEGTSAVVDANAAFCRASRVWSFAFTFPFVMLCFL